MGAGLRIQRPIQLQIQDAPWFGLALSGFSSKTWFPNKDVYGTPSHVSDFADLLWKTGFAQRRYRALSNELCFPFLKWATSIKRTLDVHSWKEPEEAIEIEAEDRQWLLRFTAILWFQLCLTLIWRKMDGDDGNFSFMRSAWTFHLQVRGSEEKHFNLKPSVGTWWAS